MRAKPWSREELILAMNLYCRLPFGRFHRRNPEVIALATAIERTPSSVAMKLSNYASFDPQHQARGVKGLKAASRADRAIWDEFHTNWNSLAVLSEKLRDQYGVAKRLSNSTERESVEYSGETETTRTTPVRLAQRFFRRSILAAYQSRCCVTGIDLPALLVASHILPWSRFPELRANPRNGLCLSNLHDAAFDRGFIAFDEQYRLVLSKRLSEATTNEVLNACFRRYEGERLHLPERFRPESSFLESHRELVFQG